MQQNGYTVTRRDEKGNYLRYAGEIVHGGVKFSYYFGRASEYWFSEVYVVAQGSTFLLDKAAGIGLLVSAGVLSLSTIRWIVEHTFLSLDGRKEFLTTALNFYLYSEERDELYKLIDAQ